MLWPAIALISLLQKPDTIRLTERLCAECRVDLVRVAVLGEDDGPGTLSVGTIVERDGKGRFLVAHRRLPGEIAVFSPEGRYMRTVGRPGGGPSEFRRIWSISPTRDGAIVYDDFARRRTFLDSSFRTVRMQPAAERADGVLLLADGTSIIAAVDPKVRHTLHVVDTAGARATSFSAERVSYREDIRDFFVRALAPSTVQTHFWSAHKAEYAVDFCDKTTRVCRTLERTPAWFPRVDPRLPDILKPDEPMGPWLVGVWQESDRYLWTVSNVPDPRWKSAIRMASRSEYQVLDWNGYFDSIVERIDLTTNTVVASQRFDQWFQRFISTGLLTSHREDQDGFVRLELLRPTLKPR